MLAVDIGGTKMAAAVVDSCGMILAEARVPTPASTDPEVVFGALTSVVDQVRAYTTAEPGGVRCGLWRTDVRRRRDGQPPQYSGLGPVPPA